MATLSLSTPSMTPPREPANEESEGSSRWKRLPYWLRQSDEHPMVQTHPGQIVEGMGSLIKSLRDIRSPSPSVGEFSRFSSQPATPDAAAHGQSSQQPAYLYPPPPGQISQQPVYSHPLSPPQFYHPSHPFPPPPFYHPLWVPATPTHQQVPHTPTKPPPPPQNNPPPSSDRSGDQRREYQPVFPIVTLINRATDIEPLIISVTFPVDSNMIGGPPSTEGACLWDTTKTFHEFLTEMRKKMRLDKDAPLGYKFSADRQKDPIRKLSTVEDYNFAMEEIQKKIRNARTKEHRLVLHNPVSTPPTFRVRTRLE